MSTIAILGVLSLKYYYIDTRINQEGESFLDYFVRPYVD